MWRGLRLYESPTGPVAAEVSDAAAKKIINQPYHMAGFIHKGERWTAGCDLLSCERPRKVKAKKGAIGLFLF